MLDLFETEKLGVDQPGFRLHKVQLWNWGTFDSSEGKVHSIDPAGNATLLIGRNGSGKSTLVDALLTLLTPPGKRSYNVAAGSTGKKERDEKSYIQGAYGHASVSESHKAQTQYLRQGAKHYSVVLAQFRNTGTDQEFTLAQMLYLNAQGRPERLFCRAERLLSIEQSFLGITSMERLKAQIQQRGFEVSNTYTDYGRWLRKFTGMEEKAMDVFNQTVAVKDIDSLDDFIRSHMLQKKNWRDTVSKVLTHFDQLTAAHEALVRARQELELLVPVEKAAKAHEKASVTSVEKQAQQTAVEPWFAKQTVRLVEPMCRERERELVSLNQQIEALKVEISEMGEKHVQLQVDINSSSDSRVQELRRLLAQKNTELESKKLRRSEIARTLSRLQLGEVPELELNWGLLQNKVDRLRSQNASERNRLESEHSVLTHTKGEHQRELGELKDEHRALLNRRTQLPEAFQYLRSQLCELLCIQENQLPFAAEMMAVKPEQQGWESSIEKVLRTMALTLLVPEQHYRAVSQLIDSKTLKDERGRGMRLHYERISDELIAPATAPPRSLMEKLEFRDSHSLTPWLKHKIAQRFNYRCCETIEEFQSERGSAMTRNRHIKHGFSRHEKDDRRFAMRDFVLGWDNRRKIDYLRGEIDKQSDRLAQTKKQLGSMTSRIEELRRAGDLIEVLMQLSFIEIDSHTVATAREEIRKELQELEQSNHAVKILQKQLDKVIEKLAVNQLKHEGLISKRTTSENDLASGQAMLVNAERKIADLKSEPVDAFSALEILLGGEGGITLTNLQSKLNQAKELTSEAVKVAAEKLGQREVTVVRAMSAFLRQFREQEAVLNAELSSLPDFLKRLKDIEKRDLPRYEKRFKDHLNEKVTQEIAVLNNKFRDEGREIEGKIHQLNQSLSSITDGSLSYMTLETIRTKDPEIRDFRQGLAECLSGSFGSGEIPDEVRYQTMAKFIKRLKDEERWRDRVIDVRRWYHFAVSEHDAKTHKQIDYYTDSAGQSGGEKARLAFTILVAAIAYQFNIDPNSHVSERFHFVMVDEMFSKVDDKYAEYALNLFKRFGLQLLIVAPFDAKARITEPFVNHYLHVIKENDRSHLLSMTAEDVREVVGDGTRNT